MTLVGEFQAEYYLEFEVFILLNIKPNFFMGFITPSSLFEWLRVLL
jgi:hypothetical protein